MQGSHMGRIQVMMHTGNQVLSTVLVDYSRWSNTNLETNRPKKKKKVLANVIKKSRVIKNCMISFFSPSQYLSIPFFIPPHPLSILISFILIQTVHIGRKMNVVTPCFQCSFSSFCQEESSLFPFSSLFPHSPFLSPKLIFLNPISFLASPSSPLSFLYSIEWKRTL